VGVYSTVLDMKHQYTNLSQIFLARISAPLRQSRVQAHTFSPRRVSASGLLCLRFINFSLLPEELRSENEWEHIRDLTALVVCSRRDIALSIFTFLS